MVHEDNEGTFPENLVTDRGGEYGSEFDAVLSKYGVEHIRTTPQQTNKAYLAERGIRTTKRMLRTMKQAGNVKYFDKALAAVISSYNASVSVTYNMTPNDAHSEENEGRVANNLEEKRMLHESRHSKKLRQLAGRLKVGDVVRVRKPRLPFEKESDAQLKFYPHLYRVW